VPRAAARFRTIRAKGSLKELDELPGIHVDERITPGYLDELTASSERTPTTSGCFEAVYLDSSIVIRAF